VTEVAIHFKRTPQTLFARTSADQIEPNCIVLRIQPDEGMTVTLAAKLPGMEMQAGTVHMVFNYESGFGVRTAAAYETLLLDALQGDATLFTRRDETEAEWRLITPIEDAWAQSSPPEFPNYAAGSDGPRAADELLARVSRRWRALGESHDDAQVAAEATHSGDGETVKVKAEEAS
jgi:glucose-6-phosphate 1-dehydrogenase